MITLYLDMDGVLANFAEKYHALPGDDRHTKFRDAVLNKEIFLHLNKMPNANKLLSAVDALVKQHKINVEILSSTGSRKSDMIAAGSAQKKAWLKSHGINYKANFVTNFAEKEQWAKPMTILIDDREDCAHPFNKHKNSYGILHDDKTVDQTIRHLNSTINMLLVLQELDK